MTVLRIRGFALPDGEPVDLFADGDRWTDDPVPGAELAAGGWLLPGLVDAHTHPGAEELGQPPRHYDPRDRTRLVHRPRPLLDSSIPTRSRRTASGTVSPAASWSAGWAAVSGRRAWWRAPGPGPPFWYAAGTATSWPAASATASGLRGRRRAPGLGPWERYEVGTATSSASTSSTGPGMTRLPPGSETPSPGGWELCPRTLSARAAARTQSAASARAR